MQSHTVSLSIDRSLPPPLSLPLSASPRISGAYLYKLDLGRGVRQQHEEAEVRGRVVDGVVEHLDQHRGVVHEVHHQALLLLHHLQTKGRGGKRDEADVYGYI